jgi:hypothetical protein
VVIGIVYFIFYPSYLFFSEPSSSLYFSIDSIFASYKWELKKNDYNKNNNFEKFGNLSEDIFESWYSYNGWVTKSSFMNYLGFSNFPS